jgi:hypothetical protein
MNEGQFPANSTTNLIDSTDSGLKYQESALWLPPSASLQIRNPSASNADNFY